MLEISGRVRRLLQLPHSLHIGVKTEKRQYIDIYGGYLNLRSTNHFLKKNAFSRIFQLLVLTWRHSLYPQIPD